jgi:hypothetical protein
MNSTSFSCGLARTLLPAVAAVTSKRLEDATALLRSHALLHSLRALDAIHLAAANALNSRSPIAGFVAADKKLLTVASAACGITTVDVG